MKKMHQSYSNKDSMIGRIGINFSELTTGRPQKNTWLPWWSLYEIFWWIELTLGLFTFLQDNQNSGPRFGKFDNRVKKEFRRKTFFA